MSNNILDNLVDNAKKEAPKKGAPQKTVNLEENDSVMGKLLQDANIDFPELGDVLDGVVIDISPHSVLLDLGSFGTGIVYGKDTRDGLRGNTKLKLGDEVHATLTNLENEEGYIELSIREASYEKAWEDLESKKDNEEAVNTRVLDANKGGLMVEINGIGGFLPVSQLASEHYPRVEDGNKNKILEKLKRLVGQTLLVKIIDTYRDEEKLIVSEKAAMSEKEQVMISRLKEGDTIEGEVSGVVDFGAFVKFLPAGVKETDDTIEGDKLEGLVHISELAWQLIDNPREIIKVGDKIKAKIIGIDEARISLSIRALAQDPWKEAQNKYEAGKVYTGKVDKINHFGAFVYLDENIHGLAHISEFSEMYPGKKMEEMMEAGKEYSWKVLSIEPKDHRMGLVLVDSSLETEVKEEKKSAKKEKAAKEEKVTKKVTKKETVKKTKKTSEK
ncbi:MAG: S1 RNA-binding domain-containing protein [Candidatus Moranbacteria bacterium]|jgi:small subunit ribosomal protein S1|nr:S1 RNA-binding domain-containing protein [Candidatus Moranbacteria bacterium]